MERGGHWLRVFWVSTLPHMELGAGQLGTEWLTTNRMAHDHGCHRAWLILEILPYDLSMGLHIKLDERLVFGESISRWTY